MNFDEQLSLFFNQRNEDFESWNEDRTEFSFKYFFSSGFVYGFINSICDKKNRLAYISFEDLFRYPHGSLYLEIVNHRMNYALVDENFRFNVDSADKLVHEVHTHYVSPVICKGIKKLIEKDILNFDRFMDKLIVYMGV